MPQGRDKQAPLFVTGAAATGWEQVVPVLAGAGLGAAPEPLRRWLNDTLPEEAPARRLEQREPPSPAPSAPPACDREEEAAWLLADDRLVWLLEPLRTAHPAARFLLLYVRPEVAVARAHALGLDPEPALDAWCAVSTEMLRFQRRHRRATVLVDATAAAADPGALLALLDLESPGAEPVPAGEAAVTGRLLGELAVRQHEDAPRLAGELAAAARPLGGTPYQPLSAAEVQGWLGGFQRTLEQRDREERALRQQLEAARQSPQREAELAECRMALRRLEQVEARLQAENDELVTRLHRAQEELERYCLGVRGSATGGAASNGSALPSGGAGRVAHGVVRVVGALSRRVGRSGRDVRRQVRLIRDSGVFDEQWYLSVNPDVAREGTDPVEHYLLHGAREQRNPSPDFDGSRYLAQHPEAAAAGANPLVHYLITQQRSKASG